MGWRGFYRRSRRSQVRLFPTRRSPSFPSARGNDARSHRTECQLMTAGSVVFLFVLTLAAGFFALNVQRLVSYLRVRVAEDWTDHPLVRLRNGVLVSIAQKKIFRDPVPGPRHALAFWGFMWLTAGTG